MYCLNVFSYANSFLSLSLEFISAGFNILSGTYYMENMLITRLFIFFITYAYLKIHICLLKKNKYEVG